MLARRNQISQQHEGQKNAYREYASYDEAISQIDFHFLKCPIERAGTGPELPFKPKVPTQPNAKQ